MDTKKHELNRIPGYIHSLEEFVSRGKPVIARQLLRITLHLFSLVYKVIVMTRLRFYKYGLLPTRKLPVPVISIGNITTGGTGKTPFTIELAKYFFNKGKRVSILSRGYGGHKTSTVNIVSDGKKIVNDIFVSGDEPYLIAKKCPGIPVIVANNRYYAGVECIRRFQPEYILLDDGYQHLVLYRDVNILLLDDKNPFSDGYLVPRGHLREPVSQVSRADMVCVIRKSYHGSSLSNIGFNNGNMHVLMYTPVNLVDKNLNYYAPLEYLKDKRVMVFCGVANPDPFVELVQKLAQSITGIFVFDDHHGYTQDDLDKLCNEKNKQTTDLLITTEKDIVKISSLELNTEIVAMCMRLDSDNNNSCETVFQHVEQLLQDNLR